MQPRRVPILVNAVYYLEHALLRIHLLTTSILWFLPISIICSGQPNCFTYFTVGTGGIRYGDSGIGNDLTTPCSDSVIRGEGRTDWLHNNFTYLRDVRSVKERQNLSTSAGLHWQESFAEKCAYSEKKRQLESSERKRQRERERYTSMTDGQKDVWLHNNREYKKLVREHKSPFINGWCTPVIQTQQSKNNQTGI
jgi:hypothetical protein